MQWLPFLSWQLLLFCSYYLTLPFISLIFFIYLIHSFTNSAIALSPLRMFSLMRYSIGFVFLLELFPLEPLSFYSSLVWFFWWFSKVCCTVVDLELAFIIMLGISFLSFGSSDFLLFCLLPCFGEVCLPWSLSIFVLSLRKSTKMWKVTLRSCLKMYFVLLRDW